MKCLVRNITVHVNDNPPFSLKDISFSLAGGEILAVVGASGAGKTTLLHALAGFLPIQHGAVILDDQTVSCASYNVSPIKRNVGYIFQDNNLLPHLSLFENLVLGMNAHELDLRREELQTLMKDLHIYHVQHQYPTEVSGGQQQRIALGRALLHNKKLLLFDEPFSGLDKQRMVSLASNIRNSVTKYKRIALIVTHQIDEAFLIADKVAILNEGILLQVDTPKNMYHQPKNLFIAGLLGPTNIISGLVKNKTRAETEFGEVSIVSASSVPLGKKVSLLTRPDDWHIVKNRTGAYTVQKTMFMGMEYMITVENDRKQHYQILTAHDTNIQIGDTVSIHLKTRHPYMIYI